MERLTAHPFCDVAGKLAFLSRKTAKIAGKRLGYRHGKRFRPYLCRFCNRFHLTTIREAKDGKH